jgi:hypothetical protein
LQQVLKVSDGTRTRDRLDHNQEFGMRIPPEALPQARAHWIIERRYAVVVK